jgi:uncharacterized repeat protein (TIGR01451 family)
VRRRLVQTLGALVLGLGGVAAADPALASHGFGFNLLLGHSPSMATVGEELTLGITLENNGDTPANTISIFDELPDSFDFVSQTDHCSATGGGACDYYFLGTGQSLTREIVVVPLTPGTVTNTASVTSPSGGEDTGVDTITVVDGTVSPLPKLSIDDVSVDEGATGDENIASFTVTRSRASSHTATVDFTTEDGTAYAPDDYQDASGTLTFAPGVLTQSVDVVIHGDGDPEPDETFKVRLSTASNATISDGTGVGTIVNDDGAPPPPPSACITVSPTATLDFGTHMLSKPGAPVTAAGSPDITVTNCGSAPETIVAHGSDATGPTATWSLDDASANPCSAGTNVYGLSLADPADATPAPLRLSTTSKEIATLGAGETLTRGATITMACAGSSGAGETLTTEVTFGASLSR